MTGTAGLYILHPMTLQLYLAVSGGPAHHSATMMHFLAVFEG